MHPGAHHTPPIISQSHFHTVQTISRHYAAADGPELILLPQVTGGETAPPLKMRKLRLTDLNLDWLAQSLWANLLEEAFYQEGPVLLAFQEHAFHDLISS